MHVKLNIEIYLPFNIVRRRALFRKEKKKKSIKYTYDVAAKRNNLINMQWKI